MVATAVGFVCYISKADVVRMAKRSCCTREIRSLDVMPESNV